MSYFSDKINFISPRWLVFSRVVAAIFAGYALATTSTLFFGQLLLTSVGKYEAVHIGMLLSFPIYACAAMWVFSVASAQKAWIGLIKLNVILMIFTWLLVQANS
ncbi:MAG: hypothetical protein V5789_07900 [Colwellia sp.]